ncbi:hypothetical protein Tco_0828769 [Tanacetum coccineum]
MSLDFATDEDLRELSVEEAWETIEDYAQCNKEWDNPPNVSDQSLANLRALAKKLFRNKKVIVEMFRCVEWLDSTKTYDQHIGNLDMMEDKVIFDEKSSKVHWIFAWMILG